MDYSKLATFDFLFSLGYVTLGSSIATLIVVAIIKFILKGSGVLTNSMNATKKDVLLSRIGRIVALVVYAGFYIIDVLVIKESSLEVDVGLFASLLSGSTLTLCISKGFYTGLRQMSKKNNVFDKLEVAQKTIFKLQKELEESFLTQNLSTVVTNDESTDEVEHVENNIEESTNNNKWVIKGE